MTREDVTRMAREAGLHAPEGRAYILSPSIDPDDDLSEYLERFATLVAEHERNKLAAWMIQRSYATGHGDSSEDLLKELEWQIRESEREVCAKVCDGYSDDRYANMADLCAEAIRARGDKHDI